MGRPTKVKRAQKDGAKEVRARKVKPRRVGAIKFLFFLFLVMSNSISFHHSGGSVHGMLVVFFLLFQLGASKTTFGAFWSSCEPLAAPEAQTGEGAVQGRTVLWEDWRSCGPGEDGRGEDGPGGSVWERVLQGEGFQRLMKQQKSSSEEEEEDSKNKKREKREKKRKKQQKKHQKKNKKNSRKAEEEDGN